MKSDPVIAHLQSVAKRFNSIEKLILFGSRSKKTNQCTSDYDVAVKWSENHPDEQWGAFTELIRENNPTLNQLDLVRWDQIEQPLKDRILEEGQTIYEKS